MSENDTAELRKRLEDERARLMKAHVFLEGKSPVSLEDELGEIAAGNDNHLGDLASATYDRGFDEGLDEGVKQTLSEIDSALTRLDEGSYGVCEVCGEPIGNARLTAIPWTQRCIEDA